MRNPERHQISNLCTRMNFESSRKPVATVGMVDDLEDIIESSALFFVNKGFRFIGFAINGREYSRDLQHRGLAEQIAQSGLDLAIVDAGLGHVDGIKLSVRLKESGIPVIMFSAGAKTPEIERVVDRFLPKPFPIDQLVQAVSRVLNIKE